MARYSWGTPGSLISRRSLRVTLSMTAVLLSLSLVAGPAAGAAGAAAGVAAPAASSTTRLVHRYLEMRLSPDGTRLATVEGDSPPGGFAPDVRDLVIRTLPPAAEGSKGARASAAPRPRAEVRVALPCGRVPQCWPGSLAWTPDGRRLAYTVRTPGSHDYALYSVGRDGQDARKVLAFAGTLQDLKYSPDGTLALLAVQGADKEVGATQAGAPVAGDLDAAPPEQRIAVLDVTAAGAADTTSAANAAEATGAASAANAAGATSAGATSASATSASASYARLQWASPPGLFVYEYGWLPNGQGFVGTAAPGDGDDNWWTAKLYAFERSDGAAARVLYTPTSVQQQLAEPRISTDGRTVAFIGGLMSDFISTGGDVYALDLGSGRVHDVTPNLPASATALEWGCDGELLATLLKGDQTQIVSLGHVHGGAVSAAVPRLLWSGQDSLGGFGELNALACVGDRAARDGDAGGRGADGRGARARMLTVQTHESFTSPPEVEVGPIGHWRDVTAVNAGLSSPAHVQSIRWRNEGFDEQGWLLLPSNVADVADVAGTVRRIPMVTSIHGGPAAANTPRFAGPGLISALLARGWAVFLPNPRGSFGQGERFAAANVRDFGYGDLRDILAGIDAAERAAPIDDARLGITGGSYGGYMTMWAVTQTQRFKAAVAGAGISDWLSYYGENGIDEWMIPYFGASVYVDPAVYARSSPITFIRNVHTPAFEYVGENDIECPSPQTQEFWHALKDLGVPTSIMIYPGEGHGLRKPADVADALARTLAWFGKYLQ